MNTNLNKIKSPILKDTYSLKGFTKALNAITEECP